MLHIGTLCCRHRLRKKFHDVNPMESVANLVDIMLAFACVLMIAIVLRRPLEKFLTDITEVQCADGKLYVSPIMDCFSGEIVALEMSDNIKKELCIDTARQLKRLYPPLAGAVDPFRSRESIHQRGFPRRAVSLRHDTEPRRRWALL